MAFPWALPLLCAGARSCEPPAPFSKAGPGSMCWPVRCIQASPLCPGLRLKTQGLPLPSLTAVALQGNHGKTMRFPFFNQELLRDVHKYVVREYIMQVIKPRRKMNGETRQQVSEKMNQEARILNNTLIGQVCEFPPGIPSCPIPGSAMPTLGLPGTEPAGCQGGQASRNVKVLKREQAR